MTKVKVSLEETKALDYLRDKYLDNEKILRIHTSEGDYSSISEARALNGMSAIRLAECLILGYEVEVPVFVEQLETHLLNTSLGEIIGDLYSSSYFKEDSVLSDLWYKAELGISDVAGHLRRKYGVIVD